MDRTLRSIIWILVVLVVLSSFSTAWFFAAKEQIYGDYLKLEDLFKASVDKLNQNIASINKEKVELKSKLDQVEKELRTLEARNNDIKSLYESALEEKGYLTRELASVKKGKVFLENKIKEMESDMYVVNLLAPKDEEIERLKGENAGMGDKIAKLEKDLSNKDKELEDIKVVFQDKSRETAQLRAEAYHTRDEVDLPPIVVNSQPQKTARLTTPSFERLNISPGLKGRIVTVNKEHNFVVIDLGKQDGVEIGNMFNVYRGDSLLGFVEVIQTRDRIAAADIKDLKQGLDIEINDIVVKR
ncbi:MAG: hypothetical protein WC569_01205 [Candidatus Omnitrophota bacterium]